MALFASTQVSPESCRLRAKSNKSCALLCRLCLSITQTFHVMLAQTLSATVDLFNVNNFSAFADFKVHCPLTKLLADTDHQLAGHLKLSWLNEHFQPITGLLVDCPVVSD